MRLIVLSKKTLIVIAILLMFALVSVGGYATYQHLTQGNAHHPVLVCATGEAGPDCPS